MTPGGGDEDFRRLETVYAAFNRRDLDDAIGLLADDFTWTFDPDGFLTGTYSGVAEIKDAIGQFTEIWETLEADIEEITRLDDERIAIAACLRGRVNASQAPIELKETVIWTLRDGEITSAHEYLGAPEDVRAKLSS